MKLLAVRNLRGAGGVNSWLQAYEMKRKQALALRIVAARVAAISESTC